MDGLPTQAVEDYLKTIYMVQQERGDVVATTILAERMGVSPSSVTNMVKKLADVDLTLYKPYQGVGLTESGREIALRVIRNHRLVELFLVEKLGVPWDQVHAQAESWEHSLSENLAERIEITLGNPTTDPHGSPIPTPDGEIVRPNQTRLANLRPGQSAVISEVSDNDADLLRYLADLALYPGETICVCQTMPHEGLITISINGTEHAIGPQVANRIFVTEPCRTDNDVNSDP
jgi:DtxR family Mn-dependent transcriptional regulator